MDYKRVHMIGIGGIGMSGLARLFLHEKKTVSGSDRTPSAITKALENEGVTLYSQQVPENITEDIDLVVYTEAMPTDNPELVAARNKKIPTMNYFEALGVVANQYYLIAIAGTHGKTTTTAMTIDVLEHAGLDPTAIVGSLRVNTGSNFRAGESKYFVVEACEYRRDFLSLKPDVLAITNLETEHLDYFKDLTDVQDAFHELVLKVNPGGVVVCNPKDPTIAPVLSDTTVEVIDYTKYLDPLLKLTQPGMHNYQNAAVARAIGEYLEVSREVANESLEKFKGTWRRFEYKGEMESGALVYDDYGHHPTEIAATLTGTRELYPDKKITLVFQPHLYSRTKELFDGFVASLAQADAVIIAPIYDARDTGTPEITSEMLTQAITKKNAQTRYMESYTDIAQYLRTETSKKDVIVVMGAGDITVLADQLIS